MEGMKPKCTTCGGSGKVLGPCHCQYRKGRGRDFAVAVDKDYRFLFNHIDVRIDHDKKTVTIIPYEMEAVK